MKKATLYKKDRNTCVRCTACSWYCTIAPASVGICATRLNRNGILYSLVYGKAVGLHLDPVEKKPLYHVLPGCRLLSFGTVGCNFGCRFCQNWEMSQMNKRQTSNVKRQNLEEELLQLIDEMSERISPKEIVGTALRNGAQGIAYTYNEPAIFAEYTHDTAKLAKEKGLKNVYVSNGFESREMFAYVHEYIDAINIDLKSFRGEFYTTVCKAKIEPVKENIRRFFDSGIETEVTTLVIPGHNDSDGELGAIARFLSSVSADIPWHVSAFRPAYRMLDTPPTTPDTLLRAYEAGKREGLRYVYVGNIVDAKHSATYCPACGELLVERDGYDVRMRRLNKDDGTCAVCKEKIYGIWR